MNNITNRRQAAYAVRKNAAELASNRVHPEHQANGDEQKYANAQYLMSFTKGLDHDPETGLLKDKQAFEAFRQAIDNGFQEPFTTRVPVPTGVIDDPCVEGTEMPKPRRRWEAPTAGTAFDLEGPDAQAVTMPPAPALCSDELTFEMAEVYELALLRDTPFMCFDQNGGSGSAAVTDAVKRLNGLSYAKAGFDGRPRKTNANRELTRQNVFRGSSPGVDKGPYLSQLMLVGNADRAGQFDHTAGLIQYGVQLVKQKVPEARQNDDYMVQETEWLEVQQGWDVNGISGLKNGQCFTGERRFITTPRDLATYVHFDALYQAYLNACLILLGNEAPFDPAFDLLSGTDDYMFLVDPLSQKKMNANAGGFALYGGPHILSLVTEVATRALKAVRYQKFNNHIRARPEVLAARIHFAEKIEDQYPSICGCLTKMDEELKDTTDLIVKHNGSLPSGGAATKLLPMAFAEGSPMHPAYGAGHATVAGACVTILKAFFDTSAVFAEITPKENKSSKDGCPNKSSKREAGFFGRRRIEREIVCGSKVRYLAYEATKDGQALKEAPVDCPLTLEGELNKLAANISIGRNMAGVHYFSDYYDSVRMGEKIAIGILEEQALTYPTDPFVLSVPTFDGQVVRIGAR